MSNMCKSKLATMPLENSTGIDSTECEPTGPVPPSWRIAQSRLVGLLADSGEMEGVALLDYVNHNWRPDERYRAHVLWVLRRFSGLDSNLFLSREEGGKTYWRLGLKQKS